MSSATPLLLLLLSATATSTITREHKVHNIVLYPDKESWCKTTAIKQIVGMKGYIPVTIDNNVCVGACFSYSIPSSEPAEPGELIRPYCDSCQPSQTSCYHVTLARDSTVTANDDGVKELPETAQKRVQIIDDCACLKCGGGGEAQGGECDAAERRTSELPDQLKNTNNDSSTSEDTTPTPQDPEDLLPDTENVGPLRELLLAHHRHLGLGKSTNDLDDVTNDDSGELDGPLREGRLARGPHGSLVLVPGRITVDAREMRPAHEGTVISYHEHERRHEKDIVSSTPLTVKQNDK